MTPKIHEKMMQADFAKRLVILTLCVALLGGGISTVMLAPQIKEAASSARQWEQERRFSKPAKAYGAPACGHSLADERRERGGADSPNGKITEVLIC